MHNISCDLQIIVLLILCTRLPPETAVLQICAIFFVNRKQPIILFLQTTKGIQAISLIRAYYIMYDNSILAAQVQM